MPFTTQALDDLGDGMFLHVDIPNYGDAAGLQVAAAEGSTQIALATVDYEVSDTLLTADEATYGDYARADSPRSGTGWTSVNGAIANAQIDSFVEATSGSETVVAFGLSFELSADYLQWFGGLDVDLLVTTGVDPQFAIGALDLTIT